MLTRDDLRTMRTFHSTKYPVMSLYFRIAKGTADEGKHPLKLKNLLAEIESQRGQWTTTQWESISQDIARIREFIRDSHASGEHNLVAFACHGEGLWRTLALSRPVPTRYHIHNHAQIKPLLRLLEAYTPTCTILVDQNRARIFVSHGEHLDERLDMVGGVPGRHDQGGWAQARLQRHHDQAVLHHLKSTAEEVFRIHKDDPVEGLLLGGTEEIISLFQEQLHPYLRERVWATFPTEMLVNIKNLNEQIQGIIRRTREAEHEDLLSQLEDGVGAGTFAVAGLEDTISALQKGQARTLIVAVGLRKEGQHCIQCGALTTEDDREACGYCGGSLAAVPDVVEDILQQAFDQGCQICSPEGPLAQRLMESGGIGALLRYAS